MRTRVSYLIAGLVVGIATAGGVAYAAISPIDGNNAVHACYNATNGAVKLNVTGACPKKGMTTPISWNVQGTPGLPGATGPAGNDGAQGTQGPPGKDAALSGASVYASGPGWVQVPNGLVEKIVPWDTASYDSDTYFDPSFPTRLTVKTRGLYLVEAQVLWDNATVGHRYIRILQNGDALGWAMQAGAFNDADWTPQRTTTQMVLNAGDYVELAAQQDSDSTRGLVTIAHLGPSLIVTRLGDVPGG